MSSKPPLILLCPPHCPSLYSVLYTVPIHYCVPYTVPHSTVSSKPSLTRQCPLQRPSCYCVLHTVPQSTVLHFIVSSTIPPNPSLKYVLHTVFQAAEVGLPANHVLHLPVPDPGITPNLLPLILPGPVSSSGQRLQVPYSNAL